MVYSFARISATVSMQVDDLFCGGKRWWLRLHEKGGKSHEVPAHQNADDYLDAYLQTAQTSDDNKSPLFRTVDRFRRITERRLSRSDALRMVKRRAAAAGLSPKISCHSFRATGITSYVEGGGTIEKAQAIAAHESLRTTELYDVRARITLDEIEKIQM